MCVEADAIAVFMVATITASCSLSLPSGWTVHFFYQKKKSNPGNQNILMEYEQVEEGIQWLTRSYQNPP